jgi:predicted deacylase
MNASCNTLLLIRAIAVTACALAAPVAAAFAQDSVTPTTPLSAEESDDRASAAASADAVAPAGKTQEAFTRDVAPDAEGAPPAVEQEASYSDKDSAPAASDLDAMSVESDARQENDTRVARLDETGRNDESPDMLIDEGRPPGASEPGTPAEDGVILDSPVVDASDRLLPVVPLADAVTTADQADATLQLLGETIPPGTTRRLAWSATELFEGVTVSTPVLVVNGVDPGPTLCLSAAVHGDELNGIEIVRRVMHDLNPEKLAGRVIGIPIVNLQGFRRGSRYLPDRRDLNRSFPGNTRGSAAARIAYSFFNEIVLHCDALIDLHTGSFERRNLPQLRANLRNPDVVTLTQGFGSTVILHSSPGKGTLRYAATQAGVPTVTLEAGGPLELELNEVRHGVKGIETLLHTLGMVKRIRLWGDPEPVYYRSSWVRANRGGILLADVSLGSTVRRGDLLGSITDPMNNATTNLYSPFAGRVIGMARNQVVMPGFAAFHIGIASEDVALPQPELADPDTDEEGDSAYPDGISED